MLSRRLREALRAAMGMSPLLAAHFSTEAGAAEVSPAVLPDGHAGEPDECGGEGDDGAEEDEDEVDTERIESRLRGIVDAVVSAKKETDLEWRLSDVIVGGALEDFFREVFEVIDDIDLSDNELDNDARSDRRLITGTKLHLLGAQIGLSLARKLGEQADRESEDPSGGPTTIPALFTQTTLFDVLYGDDLPPLMQEALYEGMVSYVSLLCLNDDRPVAEWLRENLLERLVAGQRKYLRFLLAAARDMGADVPESDVPPDLEPLDIEAAERAGAQERAAINTYLATARARGQS